MYLFIPKKTEAFTVRLDPPVSQRFERAAKAVRLKKAQITALAIEAVIEAVEINGGKLTLPITVVLGDSSTNHKAQSA